MTFNHLPKLKEFYSKIITIINVKHPLGHIEVCNPIISNKSIVMPSSFRIDITWVLRRVLHIYATGKSITYK